MTPDFQTQLRLQLREAARREERRSVLAPRGGWLPRLSPALAAGAVALLALAAVLVGLALRGPSADREATPQKVDRFSVSPTLGPILTAYGSVWAVDPVGRLLRLDPRTREVLALLDVPARTNLGAGAGSLWIGDQDTLMRMDPKTGDVVARIPFRTPRGDQFVAYDLAFAGKYAWLIGYDGVLRIDLRRNVADRFVGLGGTTGLTRGGLVQGGSLWVLLRSNRLVRLDAATGARLGSIPVRWPPNAMLGGDQNVAVIWDRLDGGLARVDLASGRELWARDLGGSIGWWIVGDGAVWVHVSTGRGKDHVVRLDARTGRVLATVQLPDLGVTSMTAVGGQLWVGTPGGQIDVVKAATR